MRVTSDMSVHFYLNNPTGVGASLGKDEFYRMKNSPFICWKMLTWPHADHFLKVPPRDSDMVDASLSLLFDDTTLPKGV